MYLLYGFFNMDLVCFSNSKTFMNSTNIFQPNTEFDLSVKQVHMMILSSYF